MLNKIQGGKVAQAQDTYVNLADEDGLPLEAGALVSLARFKAVGRRQTNTALGVRLGPTKRCEDWFL